MKIQIKDKTIKVYSGIFKKVVVLTFRNKRELHFYLINKIERD